MATIALCRVDSRLIHGQVVTKWVSQTDANHIVVMSDMLAKDPFMKSVYMMAAPPDIQVDCYGIDEGCEEWQNSAFGKGRVLVLFGDLPSLLIAWEKGFEIKKVQVGGLGGGPKRKVVFQNITLDDPDVEILKQLAAKEVEIIFQTIPEDKPQSFTQVLSKYK
ncbi:D-glucosaminate-specific PTS system IIB component [Sporomusaceae bacterium BoRhaA]|uniref:PTS system mannose/fructose/N-acetylgalactosamine-transporter subunit IIB n=1 Tax=Pelorhabdus rhamnosifermentans TaxID=2772457 RepID=UPI001C060F3D|nr:PTS sugar transporter subunit IIB [Pelorhabdus rhamnosifermentans]MBU2702735.1 D-glucosaminate-specific PTS system IIB component [Pelorhabdus rhamnosifermentans]